MSKQNIEGFLSNPFLVALKNQKNDSKSIERTLMESRKRNYEKDIDYPYQVILEQYCSYHKVQPIDKHKFKNDYLLLVKETLVEYLVEEDCLKYFLDTEEENEKLSIILKRKQFNAKLLKIVLNRVAFFMNFTSSIENNDLHLLLDRDIKRKIDEFNNNYVIQEMGALKTIVDVVTSGVKTECYLEFGRTWTHYNSDELNNYILKKHGYNYSDHPGKNEFLFINESDDKVLSLAIVNDKNFWDFNYGSRKTLLSFAHLIVKHNGIRHAEKLVDYAFEQVCKDPMCKYLYDNKFELYLSLAPKERILNLCVERLSNRLGSVTTRVIDKSDYKGFLYPLYKGFDSAVDEGKEIFSEFVRKAYPNDTNRILELFENVDSIIQDAVKVDNHIQRRLLTIKIMLEAELFGYDENSRLQHFMYSYYKNFGTKESILGRMYYRCYIIKKLTGEISNECIYEIFFNILNMIDFKYNTKCSYIFNHKLRDENYIALKNILKEYDFQIKDCNKAKYITALLDRKYATFQEVEMFPQLEQLGDAVYELAVDNILFYNPKTNLEHSNREKLVKAEAQIVVSKKLGLNNLYISDLHHSLNSKFIDHYEKIDMGLRYDGQENFIADSLEMIIGALSLDFGVQRALDFTTKVILEANPELDEPRIEKFDIVSLNNSNIGKDYLNKIYPSPFNSDNEYYWDYSKLWEAISKLLKICILGNETKEKRNEITYSANRISNYSKSGEFYEYVVSYLYNGIEETIKKYRPIVESIYRTSK